MIKKLFKVMLPIFLSVLFGGVCGKLVFSNYDMGVRKDINGEKVYLIQVGAYKDYDNMVNNTMISNYIYYQDDDGMFKSVIGVTESEGNIDKIKSIYDGEVVVSEYYSNDNELNTKLGEYDKLLNRVSDNVEIKKIVLKMLELYKDNDATLVKIIS